MKVWAIVLCTLGVFCARQGQKAPTDEVPELPRASLLVGTPPFFLMVANSHESLRLQPEYNQPKTRDGAPIYASISRDGKVIAYARLKVGVPERIVAISTYSVTAGKHTDYSEGEYSGAVVISPDASKLAFSARRLSGGGGDSRMHIVDLRTGEETLGPEISNSAHVFASWSPDSRRLAYDFNLTYDRDSEIRVWDADTGTVSKIADGEFPAWSPSGEWIAYLQRAQGQSESPSGEKTPYLMIDRWAPRCLLVHPDGTGNKTLVELPHKKNSPRFLVEAPVWSPDSKTILLNELADVNKGTVDIHLLDLKTLKVQTAFRDTLRVLGWAQAK